MQRKLFVLVILLLSASLAASQSENDSTSADIRLKEIAVQIASARNDSKLLGSSFYRLGHSYSDAKQFARAIEAYEKSEIAFHATGLLHDEVYVLADLGALYFIQEDYAKARENSERSLALSNTASVNVPAGTYPDEYGKARALLTLGDLDTHEGNYQQAVENLQQSLLLYGRLKAPASLKDLYAADVYGALGRAYPEIGESNLGLANLNKALTIATQQSNAEMMASLRNDIGYLYLEQEDYAQARAQFSESLTIYKAQNDQKEEARLLLNLGVVEQRSANYDEALRYFQLSIQAASMSESIDNLVADYEGIGAVLTAKEDLAGSLDVLNKGLVLARSANYKIREAELLWRSAQTFVRMKDYAQAITTAERAKSMASALRLRKLTYLAMVTLGESYAASKKPYQAIKNFSEAAHQLEALREGVAGSEPETELFLEDKVASYDALVDLFIEQGKSVEALLYAERAKGRVLLDMLRKERLNLETILTPFEKDTLQKLNRKISESTDNIRKQEAAKAPSSTSLYNQLDAARLQYQSFEDSLYTNHPELKMRKGETAFLTADDLSNFTLSGDTAYLEYVIAKNAVSLFVLTKNKSNGAAELKVYPIKIKPDELLRKVNEFHDSLAEQRLSYADNASELYSLLIAPAEQQLRNIDNLCIVPDSFLWNVPFQALKTSSDRFLIEDRSLYYAPSLSVQREIDRTRTTSNIKASLLAFGNPVVAKDEQRNVDVCPLPEAEQEVSSIANSFGRGNSTVLIGRDATEKAFKSLADGYSVIHLATHGVIDNRQPLYSHLVLTKTDGDPDNDGRLEARQIMKVNLHADLAVLSACETANGRIAPGEGVIGLSWAFFVAGTRATLVSQWKINSDSTSQLMTNFYKCAESDRSAGNGRNARALRSADLTMINSRRYSHPFYWAGFVLIGN
jgi:CHAT domain-containing protein